MFHACECFKTNALEFELQMVLDDPEVENPKQKSSFWILVKALKQFYAAEKRLPVSGLVPDMVGETQIYLDLQKLYIKKGEEDREKLKTLVKAAVMERGADPISEDEFILFCKNT